MVEVFGAPRKQRYPENMPIAINHRYKKSLSFSQVGQYLDSTLPRVNTLPREPHIIIHFSFKEAWAHTKRHMSHVLTG